VTEIEKYIKREIVTSSSDVVKYCHDELGIINDSNIRQRINRLPNNIYKIKGICSNNQSILYDCSLFCEMDFSIKLIDILKGQAQQHYYVINALRLHSGIIEKSKLASYSISPIKPTKGHKLFESVISDLKDKLHLIYYINDFYYSKINFEEKSSHAQSLMQRIVIEHFSEVAKNIGLISYDSVKFDSDFSNYQFGMVAPSYIKSLVSSGENKKSIPAFVLVDIIINESINVDDVIFFVKKIENVLLRNKYVKILPFILLNTHDSGVYKLLKENGIIIGNIEELFGKKYLETILGIKKLIENAGAILKTNPDQYLKLIENIYKLSTGKTYNLKGDLFEMAVGYYHGRLCQSLEIGKMINQNGEMCEIDVYAVYQEKIVFAECKGYSKPLDSEYTEKWLKEKIPLIRKWAMSCQSMKNKNIEFELWSTGGFDKKSLSMLSDAKSTTRIYSIKYYELENMKNLAKTHNIKHFNEIIEEYYKHEI
jgi:hypothetical protein